MNEIWNYSRPIIEAATVADSRNMRFHHFYPRTSNIGDHFVQRGIERMVRTIVPDATFQLLDVNSRGENKKEFGLTRSTIESANREGAVIIVGGSNLYEGSLRWPWGVHLEMSALEILRSPLLLLGIGTGSAFRSPLHQPSARARREIKLLNDHALFSGARDILSLEWLRKLGVTGATLMGDPATFIFNQPLQPNNETGHILFTVPPRRFWSSKHQFLNVHLRGRAVFNGMVALAQGLRAMGNEVVVACNDSVDLPLAQKLFGEVMCPRTPEEYFSLLSKSRAVVAGRLHTAVVAFSMGIPFILTDLDQRTHGFVRTFDLEPWSIEPDRRNFESSLADQFNKLSTKEAINSWEGLVVKRNLMYERAMNQLENAFASIKGSA